MKAKKYTRVYASTIRSEYWLKPSVIEKHKYQNSKRWLIKLDPTTGSPYEGDGWHPYEIMFGDTKSWYEVPHMQARAVWLTLAIVIITSIVVPIIKLL